MPGQGLCGIDFDHATDDRDLTTFYYQTVKRDENFITVPLYLQKIMNRAATIALIFEFMQDFAGRTGLDPPSKSPQRYLWTDAFAVCNYLGLFQKTGNPACRELALRLVYQVHHTLGRHRDDDTRTGWISGLFRENGEMHPTAGGLRIGKSLPERKITEPYDEQREWDRDGQYFHYLTKWMHALNCASRVTGNPDYNLWAIELARTAHVRFTYLPDFGGQKRMYWKMSIDLTRPLVSSMGQHDPLDGLVTYRDLQLTADREFGLREKPLLADEIEEMILMCQDLQMTTEDPLGIGGLLCDAARITRMMIQGGPQYSDLLKKVLAAAGAGLDSFTKAGSLELPAGYRLAFRELGLSIGLAGVEKISALIEKNPNLFERPDSLYQQAQALRGYAPVREQIEQFWLNGKNREAATWTRHREINTVMLVTSLAPEGFLGI